MSEAIQGNNSYAVASIPAKRKRGRPRKDKSLYRAANVRPRKHENLHRVENASAPPRFSVSKDHVDPVQDSGLVGQAVTGVVESVFDAGYLLAVKIGNSNITLRGVVFKPGHYAPVTTENDIAPQVKMIKRNEVFLPTHNQSHSRVPQSGERYEKNVDNLGNGLSTPPPATNTVSTKDQNTDIVVTPIVHPVGVRGTVVPVVLENAAAAQATHTAATKGKHVQTVTPLATYDPNESGSGLSQAQTVSHVIPSDVNSEDSQFGHGSLDLQRGNQGKPMNSMNMSFPVEAEYQGGSQSSKSQDYSSFPDQETSDMNEPLFVEPLRTVHTSYHNHPPFVPSTVGHNGIGRMTELLQAVQENLKEKQLHTEHLPPYSEVEYNVQTIPGTEVPDEQVQPPKHFGD